MKKSFKTLLFIGLVSVTSAFAEEEMTYEQYLQEMASHKVREDSAKVQIAGLEQDIAALKAQIAEINGKTSALWNEMLVYAGVTQEEYDAFVASLDAFIAKVRGFESQYAEAFKEWKAALSDSDKELVDLNKNPSVIFPRLDSKVASAAKAIDDSRNALRLAIEASKGGNEGSYTVRLIPERRDCLWRIAEYDDVYGDAFQWPKIYSANQDQIKDPDMIFPGQVFQIPR